ncbi:hypothetical protein GCM10010378_57200 [Streptomyces viridochromogenes]
MRGRQRRHRHSEALTDFFARFDPPADAEDVIVYHGDMETLVTDLRQARQGWRLPHRDRYRDE